MTARTEIALEDRISVTRSEAAALLGVSTDLIKAAQSAGVLPAKNTSFDADGRPVGVTLYAVADLRDWFDRLGDA